MITAMVPVAAAAAEAVGVSPTGSAATIPARAARPIIPVRRATPAAAGAATAAAVVVAMEAEAEVEVEVAIKTPQLPRKPYHLRHLRL
jgi:hypothetical protein